MTDPRSRCSRCEQMQEQARGTKLTLKVLAEAF